MDEYPSRVEPKLVFGVKICDCYYCFSDERNTKTQSKKCLDSRYWSPYSKERMELAAKRKMETFESHY